MTHLQHFEPEMQKTTLENLGTGQKPCNPGFALRKTWVTGFLSCTKPENSSAPVCGNVEWEGY